ncbi:peptidyl-prolyl cis-trans isomerase [bacterium]|nr:peptidyl-prolyl cis-trans isomerase [candidate division CSSED10-310 bacterium]
MHWKKWLRCVDVFITLMMVSVGCGSQESVQETAVALWIDGEATLVPQLKARVAVRLMDWGLEDDIGDEDIQRAITSCIRDLCVEKVIRQEANRLGLKAIEDTGQVPEELKRYGEGFEFMADGETEWWNRVVSGLQVMDLAGGISEHLARDIDVTDEMIRQEYEQRLDYFTKPERLEFRIIRVYDADLAKDLYAQLKRKWKFETLAQKHSNLKGEGAQGESVIKQAGELPSEFEAELIQLKPGEISRVLAASEGYFIYKLIKKYPPEVLPLESVRDRLQEELVVRLRSRIFQDWLDQEVNKLEIRQGTPLADLGDGT